MAIVDVCRSVFSGAETFVSLAVRGRIGPDEAWVGMRGAARAVQAIANGDVASAGLRSARLSACLRCPYRTVDAEIPEAVGWCGEPFKVTDQTCGCNLEAKASVGSETCVRWPV